MADGGLGLLLQAMDTTWAHDGWHPPLTAAIEGMTAAQAAWQARPDTLTARQFVQHVAYWKEAALRTLDGQDGGEPEGGNEATFGAPGDGADEAGWQAAIDRLHRAHAALVVGAKALPAARAADPKVIGLLLGLANHDAYHGGEIVQLRKLQGAWH